MSGAAGPASALVHGTCVARSGRAALLRGPSGSGKSDLALRFLWSHPETAALVSDDQVRIEMLEGLILAAAPPAIAGLLEVRGLGILSFPALRDVPLGLVVDLVGPGDVPRLPPDPLPIAEIFGIRLPLLRLAPFEASAAAKLALALRA